MDEAIAGSGAPEIVSLGWENSMTKEFSPGGRYIAVGGTNVSLWTVDPLERVRTFPGTSGYWVSDVTFSPDGRSLYAVTAYPEASIYQWETSTGKLIWKEPFPPVSDIPEYVFSVATMADGKNLLVGTSQRIVVLDPSTHRRKQTIPEKPTHSVVPLPGSTSFLRIPFYFNDNLVECWNLSDSNPVWTYQTDDFDVIQAIPSPDGGEVYLFSIGLSEGEYEYRVDVVDSAAGKGQTVLQTKEGISSIYPLPEQNAIVLADRTGANLYLFDLATKKRSGILSVFDVISSPVEDPDTAALYSLKTLLRPVVLSPDGRYAATGELFPGVIDMKTGEATGSFLHSPVESFMTFGLSRDGSTLIVDSDIEPSLPEHMGDYAWFWQVDNSRRAWNMATGDLLREVPATVDFEIAPVSIFYTLDSFKQNNAYALSDDGTIGLYIDGTSMKLKTPRTDRLLRSLGDFDPGSYGFPVADFSTDNRLLVLSRSIDRSIEVWNVETGRKRSLIPADIMLISILISPDGERVYGSDGQGVHCWAVETGEYIGSYIATKDDGWAVVTAAGYFNGNEAGVRNLRVRMGNRLFPLDNYYETFFNPVEVATAFSGGDSAAREPALTMEKITVPPPRVEVSLRSENGAFIPAAQVLSEGTRLSSASATVRVAVDDMGGGISELRVSNNGKSVETTRGLGRVGTGDEYIIPLVEGRNEITAVAFSDQGIRSTPSRILVSYTPPEQQAPDMYVLAVGIDEYRNARYNLNYAVEDTQGFLSSLKSVADSLYDEVFVTAVYNDQATRENIISELQAIGGKAEPEDVFVFYYAGHGIALLQAGTSQSEFYYVLHDVTQMTSSDIVGRAGISGSEIRDLFQSIPALKQVALLDACNSGAFAAAFAYRGAAEEQALAKLSRATGSAIIAATRDDQFASEIASLGHGAFTMAVIEAFGGSAAGSNRQVTASSLRAYLDDRLPELSSKYSGTEQFPISFIFGQDFPIGLLE